MILIAKIRGYNMGGSHHFLNDKLLTAMPHFSLQSFTNSLFRKKRAIHVGDSLIVALDESVKSNKKAAAITKENSPEDSDLTRQQNLLTGSITVRVEQILPRGILLIRGEKWLQPAKGDEYLRLLGTVTQDNISYGNTISSQRITDARIIYSHSSATAEDCRQYWTSRYFSSHWQPL